MKKKGFMVIVAAVLIGVFSMASCAQGEDKVDKLLDLLVQKQVLTSNEAAALKAEVDAPAATAPAKADDRQINMKGHLKLQAQFGENDTTVDPDSLRIRQARMVFYGSPARNFKYTLGLAAERSDPTLLDAAITYVHSDTLSVKGGQFKIPFSRESLASGSKIDLLERAYFLDQYRPANGRDIGLMFTVNARENLKLELGAFHGNGKNSKDSNDQKLLVARASGKTKIGSVALEPEAAIMFAPSEGNNTTTVNSNAAPFDKTVIGTGMLRFDKQQNQWGLVAFYKNFSFSVEYMKSRYVPQDPALTTIVSDGLYAQLGLPLWDKLDGFLRFENFDSDLKTTTNSDVTWYTAGLKYHYYDNLKFKLNYTWKKEAVTNIDNDKLGFETVLIF